MNSSIIIAAIAGFALTFLTGLILFIRGLRGRWFDSHPYCRKCRYNLTGQTSEKCPECGTTLDQRIVAFRIRKRRRLSLVFGMVLLLIPIGLATPLAFTKVRTRLAQANWCRFYTLSMLLTEAERNDVNAFDELFKRISSGKLSEAKLATIGDRAIQAHHRPYAKVAFRQGKAGAGKSNVTSDAWCDLILKLNELHPLTQQQSDLFFGRVAGAFEISIRERVACDKPLIVQFERRMRGSAELMYREVCYISLDDGPELHIQVPYARNRASGQFQNGAHVPLSPELEPGVHRVEVVCNQVFRTKLQDAEALSREKELKENTDIPRDQYEIAEAVDQMLAPLWKRTIKQMFEVEIAQPEVTTTVDVVKNVPAETEQKNPFTKVGISAWQQPPNSAGGPKQTVFSLGLDVRLPPDRCAAYVVVGILENREIILGSIAFEKGTRTGYGRQFSPIPMEDIPDKFDNLIFRPSALDAEKTIDCFEIVDGVIEFGPIPVTVRRGK